MNFYLIQFQNNPIYQKNLTYDFHNKSLPKNDGDYFLHCLEWKKDCNSQL